MNDNFLNSANAPYVAELYFKYTQNPKSIDESWKSFFSSKYCCKMGHPDLPATDRPGTGRAPAGLSQNNFGRQKHTIMISFSIIFYISCYSASIGANPPTPSRSRVLECHVDSLFWFTGRPRAFVIPSNQCR